MADLLVGASESSLGLPPAVFGPPGRRYARGRELGRGAFGKVLEATPLKDGGEEPAGPPCAVKAMNLRGMRLSVNYRRDSKNLRREVHILQRLPPHPHVVRMVEVIEEGDWLYLVLELVRGGDLFNTLIARAGPKPRMMEGEASFVFWQLAEGLRFLHSHNIMHRDLKLENVLVASAKQEGPKVLYVVKITDFGLSKSVGSGLSEARSTVGTKRYTAPEVLREGAYQYDFRVDVWSLGILLYVLLDGRYPHDRPAAVKQEVLDAAVARLETSVEARQLLKSMLQLSPSKRASLEEVLSKKRPIEGFGESGPPGKPITSRIDSVDSQIDLEHSLFGSSNEQVATPPPAPERETSSTPLDTASMLSVAPVQAHGPQRSSRVAQQQIGGAAYSPQLPRGLHPATSSSAGTPGRAMTHLEAGTFSFSREVASVLELLNEEKNTKDDVGILASLPTSGPQQSQAFNKLEHESRFAVVLRRIVPLSTDRHELQLHVLVQDRIADSLLEGKALQQIAEEAGCKVWISTDDDGADRSVIIVGNYVQCSRAQTLLYEHMLKVESSATSITFIAVLLIRREAIGAVIGSKGRGLEKIHQQSGAYIQVLRDEAEGLRPCTIFGSFANVLRAEELVVEACRKDSKDRQDSRLAEISTAASPPALPAPPPPPPPRGMTDIVAKRKELGPPPPSKRRRGNSEEPIAPELSSVATPSASSVSSTTTFTKMLVPARAAGAVIGRQGAGLRNIQTAHGAQIDVLRQDEAPEWTEDRLVILRGNVERRTAALEAVLRAVDSDKAHNRDDRSDKEASCKLKMLVASSQAGHVVGKKGSGLRSIQEQHGVTIEMKRDEVLGDRTVIVTGQFRHVAAAAATVIRLVDRGAQREKEEESSTPIVSS